MLVLVTARRAAIIPLGSALLHPMKMIKESVIILGLSIAVAFTVNYFSPAGIAVVGQWDTAQGVVTARAKNDIVINDIEIETVGLARALFDTGDYIFVDARSVEDYQQGHIKGAVSLPVGQVEEGLAAFLERYPPETPIVTYCSGRTCEDSHHLAEFLMEVGYEKINVFIDGFPGWEAEGHPVD
jgi:rhodanese-related sulfurtransferase